MSRIGDWGERPYIHVYRRGSSSRLLDEFASHPCNFESLQELMDITLELGTRYHERQKENGIHQEKKPPVTGSNSFRPPQDSSSKKPHNKNSKKGMNFQVSRDKTHSSLLNRDKRLAGSETKRGIKKFYEHIVMERAQSKNASRGLRIGQGHQEAYLASR
ncbi:hypothetical protein O181_026696 [Austropuccinia psidii MF-1]|uniref:Uncharacterized protein n=1 Tax=Austropuccinia psidii MF-1 TaxID=1389203 RepID=A0A9Q3CQZ2_9BASI|nr:hypothetical protein [Austropuccinia psidii MF-1]